MAERIVAENIAVSTKMTAKIAAKQRHLRGIPEDSAEAEFRAFRKMLPKLLKRYEGEHVAIYKGKLVGTVWMPVNWLGERSKNSVTFPLFYLKFPVMGRRSWNFLRRK